MVGLIIALAGEGWAGVAVGRRSPCFLACRGLLAFTYSPLVGDVSAPRKYAHNVAMMGLVALAGWVALRPRTGGAGGAEGRTPGAQVI